MALSLLLQFAVVYLPFLQRAFSTVGLSAGDWLRCTALASLVLWVRELSKVVARARQRPAPAAQDQEIFAGRTTMVAPRQ
jgi:Ca2+-transporting ATPase